jgi:hypothetical protein
MKRLALLLAAVLCSAALLQAAEPSDKKDDADKGKSMSGMICNSKCVTETGGKSACNKTCAETKGDVVFIDSKGAVMKIENQDKAMSMAGKKVKMKAKMMDGGMMHIYEIAPATY